MTEAKAWRGTNANDRFVFDDSDRFDFVTGGQGDDFISDAAPGAFWSNDFYRGNSGNDILISTGGHDILRGGEGSDVFDVTVGWYDPDTLPGSWQLAGSADLVGFKLQVIGGSGHDVLTVMNSAGYKIEYEDDLAIIHTPHDGIITAKGVEEFLFL